MIRERFTSRVALYRPDRIDVNYQDGPFRYLNNHWSFIESEGGGCDIDFYIDFEFKSKTLQKVIGTLFNEAVQRMVNAFENRATKLYAPEMLTTDFVAAVSCRPSQYRKQQPAGATNGCDADVGPVASEEVTLR